MDCSVLLRWFYLSTAFLGRNKTEPTSNKHTILIKGIRISDFFFFPPQSKFCQEGKMNLTCLYVIGSWV